MKRGQDLFCCPTIATEGTTAADETTVSNQEESTNAADETTITNEDESTTTSDETISNQDDQVNTHGQFFALCSGGNEFHDCKRVDLQFADLISRVKNLEEKQTATEEKLQSTDEKLADAKDDLKNLTVEFYHNKKETDTAIDSALDKMEGLNSTTEKEISTISDMIQDVDGKVATNINNISRNKDSISSNTASISDIKKDVQRNFDVIRTTPEYEKYQNTILDTLSRDEMKQLFKQGTKVMRGRDWPSKYNHQGVAGGQGTITSEMNSNGWVSVSWDNGYQDAYCISTDCGRIELKLA